MTDDVDDDLGIDLDAWQPPPPVPGGVADGVIARLRRDVTTQIATTPVEVPARRRWWIAGGTAVALVAGTVLLVAFGSERPPADGLGEVSGPTRIDLGPSSADVDPGAYVGWKRERYRITAAQRGRAAWHIHEDDTLTIDTEVASIEASNASLRVEIDMNKETVTTSAVTAAVVALVTVVVYDGTARVTADGKTVSVPAGKSYQVRANENVFEEDLVAANVDDLKRQIAELEQERRELLEQVAQQRTVEPDVPAKQKPACDAGALFEQGKELLAKGSPGTAIAPLEAAYRCKPERRTQSHLILAVCKSQNVAKARDLERRIAKADRDRLLAICLNYNVTLEPVAEHGTLRIASKPAAEIFVDGTRIGRVPRAIELTPGRHKVTFVVGHDKHTFSVLIKAGETVILHKQFE